MQGHLIGMAASLPQGPKMSPVLSSQVLSNKVNNINKLAPIKVC